MRKRFNQLIQLFVLCLAAALFCGCSLTIPGQKEIGIESGSFEEKNYEISEDTLRNEEYAPSDEETIEKPYRAFSIRDIDWTIENSISQNKRKPAFRLTNHTDYTIVSIVIDFVEKDGVTDEERESFIEHVLEIYGLDESNSDDAERIADIRNEPLSIGVRMKTLTLPGKSHSGQNCYYFGGLFAIQYIEDSKLFEPDIYTIRYVADERIHTMYYDCQSGKYEEEESTKPAYYWTEYPLGEQIPKPDAKVIEKDVFDQPDNFAFIVQGWSEDQFSDYVSLCRNAGFTVDEDRLGSLYNAKNNAGYKLHLNYSEDNMTMYGSIEGTD